MQFGSAHTALLKAPYFICIYVKRRYRLNISNTIITNELVHNATRISVTWLDKYFNPNSSELAQLPTPTMASLQVLIILGKCRNSGHIFTTSPFGILQKSPLFMAVLIFRKYFTANGVPFTNPPFLRFEFLSYCMAQEAS